jgi:hypothetical protein
MNLKSQCEKHGDVSSETLTISQVEGNILRHRHYCIYCLADILDSLQKSFETPKLKVDIIPDLNHKLEPEVS